MIIVDLSQVMVSTIMSSLKGKQSDIELDVNLIRHMVLNTLRTNINKFKDEFGDDVVIACDSGNVWRKDVFPYYKARRKIDRDASSLNWNEFFECMSTIRDELRDYFPYKVIRVERAEADDIIAIICKEYHPHGKIMILSGDKDFQQLQKYRNIFQYNPVLKKNVVCNDPEKFLKEQILKGDSSDGVPNILSTDSVFVDGGRQTPLTAKRIAVYIDAEPQDVMSTMVLRNYSRNKTLIDLDNVPAYIEEEIIKQYENPEGATDRSKLFNYFITHKLKNLMETIGDF